LCGRADLHGLQLLVVVAFFVAAIGLFAVAPKWLTTHQVFLLAVLMAMAVVICLETLALVAFQGLLKDVTPFSPDHAAGFFAQIIVAAAFYCALAAVFVLVKRARRPKTKDTNG